MQFISRHRTIRLIRWAAIALIIPAGAGLKVAGQTSFPAEMPSAAAGETGELSNYGYPTQIGTVACRTIRDRTGRVAREVYYTGNLSSGAITPEQELHVQSIRVYYYDAKGRVDHVAHWERRKPKPRVEHNSYDAAGELTRKWYVDPDGVKRYEMRFRNHSTIAELYFDETGAYLTSLRGHLVSDLDLPHGWGEISQGVACGITLTTERGRFDKIGVWVNIKNVARETLRVDNLGLPVFQLRDANGKAIAVLETRTPAARDFDRLRYLDGQSPDEGEAGFMYPEYKLADFFDPLPPGKYTIRILQHLPERDVVLLSNDVSFVVL